VENFGGSADLDGVVDGASGEDGHVGAQVDRGCADGGEKGRGKLARVEAVFVEEDETLVSGDKCGEEVGEILGGEFGTCASAAGLDCLQGGMGLEGNADA
jgi:hypothetical protein